MFIPQNQKTVAEKKTCHETFLFSLKKTNNGENVVLLKCGTSHEGVMIRAFFVKFGGILFWLIFADI